MCHRPGSPALPGHPAQEHAASLLPRQSRLRSELCLQRGNREPGASVWAGTCSRSLVGAARLSPCTGSKVPWRERRTFTPWVLAHIFLTLSQNSVLFPRASSAPDMGASRRAKQNFSSPGRREMGCDCVINTTDSCEPKPATSKMVWFGFFFFLIISSAQICSRSNELSHTAEQSGKK